MIALAVFGTGAFAVALGALHFTFPRRFGFVDLLKGTEPHPPLFELGPYRQTLSRSDVLGLVYVMNHAASLSILSIGIFDLFVFQWLGSPPGAMGSVAAALFWGLRATAQLYLGRRPGDYLIMAGFGTLAVVQLLPVIA